MPRVLELLEQYRPDLVFLQETKSEPDAFPDLELAGGRLPGGPPQRRALGGRRAARARRTRRSTNVCAGLEGEPARDEARWIEADVDGVRAVSVYVPNGQAIDAPAFADKLRFLEAIAERVPELVADERPVVIARRLQRLPHRPRRVRPGGVRGRHARDRRRAHSLRGDPRRRASSTPSAACTRTRPPTRGGTTAPATSTRASGCGSTTLLATPDLADQVERAGSRATTARARSPRTTRRSSRSSAPPTDGIDDAGRVRLQTGLSHR